MASYGISVAPGGWSLGGRRIARPLGNCFLLLCSRGISTASCGTSTAILLHFAAHFVFLDSYVVDYSHTRMC